MNTKQQATEEEVLTFLDLLTRLNPIEFLGVATILQIDCFYDMERKNAKPVDELMGEIFDAYVELSRAQRKVLIKKMKKAAR